MLLIIIYCHYAITFADYATYYAASAIITLIISRATCHYDAYADAFRHAVITILRHYAFATLSRHY